MMHLPQYTGLILAFMQIIIGALLLAQRYKLIGVFAVLPISLALFLFTLQWKGTVFVNIFFLVFKYNRIYAGVE